MSIDWITVSAQIVNFLILVWLLHHFLYQPVISAMDRREQRVTARLKDAEECERLANEQRSMFAEKTQELEQHREQQLSEATREATLEKQIMLDKARSEVAKIRDDWQQLVEQEKNEFLTGLRSRMAESLVDVARKALGDLADTNLEQQTIESFLRKLSAMEVTELEALKGSTGPIHIRTSFSLEQVLRSRLTQAIQEHLGVDIEITFAESEDLLCGIELKSGEQRLSWNFGDYLNQLNERFALTLSPGLKTEA